MKLPRILVFTTCILQVCLGFAVTKEDHEKMKSLVIQGQKILETEPKNAEGLFNKALALEKTETALKGLGWSYWKQKHPEKAIVIWQELSEKHPEDLKLKNQLAKLNIELKNVTTAEKIYLQVLQRDPKNIDALIGIAGVMNFNHNYASAQQIFKNLATQAPKESARFMKPWGLSLFEDRKYEEALPKWEYVTKHNPSDIPSQAYLGRTLYHLGQYEKALPILKKVTEKDPGNIKALETQLLYAKFQKNHQESKRLLDLLILSSPQNIVYLNYYGAVLMETKEYDRAIAMFEKSLSADPNQVDPRISITEINGLKGMKDEETQLYRRALLTRFPNIAPRISHGIVDAYEINQNADAPGEVNTSMDFSENSDLEITDLQNIMKKYPGDLSVQLRLAKLHGEEKNFKEAFQQLDQIEHAKFSSDNKIESKISIPALLYHRITLHPGEGVLTQAAFEDQLKALKNAGYQSISVQDLNLFYKNKGNLPEHPILITFDDAIKEVQTYADPVLEKYGFKATMFVPTHVIENKKSFFMTWNDLNKLSKTGRWDLQCHSDYGHEPIQISSNGHTGRFLINRKWLQNEKRLETEDEFRARIEQDYVDCKNNLQKNVPGVDVIAYSFPYGDFGTESSTNSKQDVSEINLSAVKKNFALSFVQRYPGFNIASTPPELSMRINVNETWTGNDLLGHLKAKDPIVQAKSTRAAILLIKGDQNAAIKLAQSEDLEHKDPTAYYKTLSTAYEDMGNSIEAMRALDHIGISDQDAKFRRNELADNLAPEFQFSFDMIRDNNNRQLLKPSVRTRSHLTDHFFGRAYYEHGFYEQDRQSVPVSERKAQSDSFGFGAEYYWDDYTTAYTTVGFQNFDTGLISYTANGEVTLPIVRKYLSFTTRANHQVLELSRAIHQSISQTNVRGGFFGNPTDRLYYKLSYEYKWLSDSNRINHIANRIKYKLTQWMGIYAGAYFDYQDSTSTSVYYYSPQSSRQGLGEFGSAYSWNKFFRTNIATRLGAGKNRTSDILFTQEYSFDAAVRLGKNTDLEGEFEYGNQPGYSAIYGTLTLSTRF